jgi:hypothetical protein
VNYLAALALTLAVEVPLYVLVLRAPSRSAAAVNLVSHPVAWFVLWPLLRSLVGDGAAFVVVELAVCAGEWAALRRLSDGMRVASVVLVANAASLVAGAVVL